jgi:two-component system cell cycle sensor histidine kinase PleC
VPRSLAGSPTDFSPAFILALNYFMMFTLTRKAKSPSPDFDPGLRPGANPGSKPGPKPGSRLRARSAPAMNSGSENPDTIIPQAGEEPARLAISEDGAIVFANESFRMLSGMGDRQPGLATSALSVLKFGADISDLALVNAGVHRVGISGAQKPVDFHFNWLTVRGNRRYLVGSETRVEKYESAVPDEEASDDFFTLAGLTDDLMLVIGEDGNIRRANAAFLKSFGCAPGDLGAMDFIDIFHADDKPYIRNTIRSMEFGEPGEIPVTDFQARIVTLAGAQRWIEWRQKRARTAQGEIMYCVGRDVTAIREQQLALGRRERQLGQAESIGRMGHWNWNLGQEDIQWSDELYNIFGVARQEFRPTLENISRHIQKRDLARVNHVLQRATMGQNNYETEFRVVRPDGEIRFLRCEGRCARDSNGEVTALYGIMQDMTERILYERELKHAKDSAERAYAAKSQFLANMSHELRTPLNAIIGFSEMMHRQLLGPIGTEKYLEYIKGILESGEHLLDLISDILDMSKIEAGKYELGFEEVKVIKTVRLAAHMMESRAGEAGVRMIFDALDNENLSIIADRRAFLQVILNILSNAVKFTPKGGQVKVECSERKEFISLKFTDTGIGIPANKLASITKPFEQVSSHYTREHDGTGLGLAITKELVEMHGGTLLIDSAVGVGTCVTVRLPYDASLKQPEK